MRSAVSVEPSLSARERLVVAGVVASDVHADRDDSRRRRCVAYWTAGAAGAHRLDEVVGEVGERMREVGLGRGALATVELSTAKPPGSVRSTFSK